MAEATPALKAVLADFHGMNLTGLFGLDRFEINFIAKGDLAAGSWRKSDIKKEVAKNWKTYYDCVLAHHFLEGRKKGMPGFSGHLHKWQVWSYESPVYGAYNWVQLGCMCKPEASFMDADKWNLGFSLVHVDTKTKTVQFEYIPVGQTFALSAGKFYERRKGE
jgi:hypothetical protein